MANPKDIFGVIGFAWFSPLKMSTFELGPMEAWDFGAGWLDQQILVPKKLEARGSRHCVADVALNMRRRKKWIKTGENKRHTQLESRDLSVASRKNPPTELVSWSDSKTYPYFWSSNGWVVERYKPLIYNSIVPTLLGADVFREYLEKTWGWHPPPTEQESGHIENTIKWG